MSLAKALCSMLAFAPAKVLAKDFKLEVVIQNGKLEVIEVKWPQKVSTSFKKSNSNSTFLQLPVVLQPLHIE